MKQAINDSRNRISIHWLLAAAFVVSSAGGACMIEDEAMDLEAVGDVAQEVSIPYLMVSASASDSLPGWGPEHLIDGDIDSPYSSQSRVSPAPDGAWVAAWLDGGPPQKVSEIRLYARIHNGIPMAFPLEYQVYLTSPDNSAWDFVGTYSDQPVDGLATVEFSPRLTYGVHIVPTILGTDDYGNHYFQLAEIELGGFVVNQTTTTSRVAVVNSLDYQNLNISTTDLANSDQSTFSSLTGTNTNAAITSGIPEGPYVDYGTMVTPGQETIINLDTSVNVDGYDITSLYLAFGNKVSGDLRSYDVYFSRVGNDDYTLVTSVVKVGQMTGSWSSANWGDDTITPASEAVIAENVDSIKVVWNAVDTSIGFFRIWEIDVYGSASN